MSQFNWSSPELSAEDQRVIDAYVAAGVSLDDLPYSDQFDELMRRVGGEDTQAARHNVWKRLLQMRKRGLLPRLAITREDLRQARSA